MQRRVEAGVGAGLGIRFLAAEYPPGPWHRGRTDSLGLDENGTRGSDEAGEGMSSARVADPGVFDRRRAMATVLELGSVICVS